MEKRPKLDKMAASFYRALLLEFPDWRGNLRFLEDRTIELDVPQPDGRRQLRVVAGGNQISIYYGDWHFCVGTYLGWTEDQTAQDVAGMMKNIVSEEVVVHIPFKDGKSSSSGLTHNCVPAEAKEGEMVNVYSWRGTYDRVIEGPYAESWDRPSKIE